MLPEVVSCSVKADDPVVATVPVVGAVCVIVPAVTVSV